jgi:hypothetical protein
MRTWDPWAATTLIGCKFGFENFLDLLLAWLTLFPLSLPFPQISHLPATGQSSIYSQVIKRQA